MSTSEWCSRVLEQSASACITSGLVRTDTGRITFVHRSQLIVERDKDIGNSTKCRSNPSFQRSGAMRAATSSSAGIASSSVHFSQPGSPCLVGFRMLRSLCEERSRICARHKIIRFFPSVTLFPSSSKKRIRTWALSRGDGRRRCGARPRRR
jgi:hypothetical protein